MISDDSFDLFVNFNLDHIYSFLYYGLKRKNLEIKEKPKEEQEFKRLIISYLEKIFN
jgi:hypothetical protein